MDNVFTNVVSVGNALDGVYVAAGLRQVFSNIVCTNNGQDQAIRPSYGVNINVDSASVTDGVLFNGVVGEDTQSQATQRYGVAIGSGVTRTRLAVTRFKGNHDGDVLDNGTSSVVTA